MKREPATTRGLTGARGEHPCPLHPFVWYLTNVVLRGLANIRSGSGRIAEAVEERAVLLLLSKPVLEEYRVVLGDPAIVERVPKLTVERVEVALRRFRYLGEYLRTVRSRVPERSAGRTVH
jgi:hypothetical protein